MCNLRYKGNAGWLGGKGCIPSLWNDQVLKVFVMIERMKEKKRKFHTPIDLLKHPQKLIHKKLSIEEGS
jgi:hypothetical protein